MAAKSLDIELGTKLAYPTSLTSQVTVNPSKVHLPICKMDRCVVSPSQNLAVSFSGDSEKFLAVSAFFYCERIAFWGSQAPEPQAPA